MPEPRMVASRMAVRCVTPPSYAATAAEARISSDGRLAIVAWNGTVDVTKAEGDPVLDREVTLAVEHLPADRYRIRHRRLDRDHSNIVVAWGEIGDGADWPDAGGWDALAERDRLEELEPERAVMPVDGRVDLRFALPMPSITLIELDPD